MVPGPAPAAPGGGSCRVQRVPVQAARAGAAVFAVPPPCLQCTQPAVCLRGPRGRARCRWRWARHGHRERRGCSLLAALCGPCRVPVPAGCCGCAHVLPLRPLTALNTGTALKPSQPFPSALTLSAPHFPTLDLLSVPTSFPRACPHIRFPRRSCVTPPAMGTAPSHRHRCCHQLSRPCHPLTNALQGADRAEDTLVPTNILVHTGHPQEAGGSPGPWSRWAAGRGRTLVCWDLCG